MLEIAKLSVAESFLPVTGSPEDPDSAERIELPLSDFDYHLPPNQIAQRPADQRDQSRLLVLDRASGEVRDHTRFAQIGDFLEAGDLLVMNETRVSALRLCGQTETGSRAELLLTHRVQESVWHCLAKPGKRLRLGARVEFDGGLTAEVIDVLDERGGRAVRLERGGQSEGVDEALDRIGLTPLPPYIHSDDPNRLRDRYQTIYATNAGSAAAPTAGLHFTPEVFQRIAARGADTATVTLHVGVGTFRPIDSPDVRDHVMHEERGEIPAETADKIRSARGRIVAVGTTTVRTLEGASKGPREVQAGSFRTQLYVTPGYRFQTVDAMITNFHMPRSSLLVLVSAFAGTTAVQSAYRKALDRGYRFLSFGDSMLIIDSATPWKAEGEFADAT